MIKAVIDTNLLTKGETISKLLNHWRERDFILLTSEGNADYIISGDEDLLDLEEYQETEIIKAWEFITMLKLGEALGGKE